MALRLFDARRKSSSEQSKRGQGRQPRTEEDRRLAGVPACRNRVAEIGSRNRGSEKLEGGPLRRTRGRTSFFEWAGATPRGDHLGRGVARRWARALRVTGRLFQRTTPRNWWVTGSPTCWTAASARYRRKASRVVPSSLPFTGWRGSQPRPRRESRRSSERAARETRSGDRGARGQDRNVFRFLETCRDVKSRGDKPHREASIRPKRAWTS
jgi:hypothetical protein